MDDRKALFSSRIRRDYIRVNFILEAILIESKAGSYFNICRPPFCEIWSEVKVLQKAKKDHSKKHIRNKM